MPDQRSSQPPAREQRTSAPKETGAQRAGRSGEGVRSVIPHLRADLKARAVAKIAKRPDREL